MSADQIVITYCAYRKFNFSTRYVLSIFTSFHFPSRLYIYFWFGSIIIIIAKPTDSFSLLTNNKKNTCIYFMSMCAINMNRILFRHYITLALQSTHTPIYMRGSLLFAYVVVIEGVGMRIAPAIYVSLCGK